MLTPHCSAVSGMVAPSSTAPITRARKSSEYGFAIHAGLLPAGSLNHIRAGIGIPLRFSLFGKRSSWLLIPGAAQRPLWRCAADPGSFQTRALGACAIRAMQILSLERSRLTAGTGAALSPRPSRAKRPPGLLLLLAGLVVPPLDRELRLLL